MKQMLKTSVIGSYPIYIDTLELVNDYFSERLSSWTKYIEQAVHDMTAAGIKYVSDGQTRDPFIQLFTRKLGGCRIRDRTEIIGHVEYHDPITLQDQKYTRQLLPRTTRLVGILTGPYTLTKSSVDLFYHDEKELCFDFAAALRNEAILLQKHVDLISIDEPFFSNELPEYAKELIGIITNGLSCSTRLHVCGDVSQIIPHLVEMPVEILSHEFKASPHLFESFREYSCLRKICVGAVRSDDVHVESVEEIVTHIKKAIAIFGENVVQIAPDCGQRLLPRETAFHKLKNLAIAGEIINGG
ncbi:Methionine synthase [uncultured archaeon]|nr:Methionine synthase [uncultured archaeon]